MVRPLVPGALRRWWRPVRVGPTRARLYIRGECELCERAQELLHEFVQARRLDLQLIDIDDDPALQRRYGITIPVLDIDGGACLEWPFERSDVRGALR